MHRAIAPALLISIALLGSGCVDVDTTQPRDDAAADAEREVHARAERVLELNLERIVAYADSIEQALRPEPLLRGSETAAFGRFQNAHHLARARQLGIPQPVTAAAIERHLESGRLVTLEDSDYWIIRELDYSSPLVVPDVTVLLTEIGRRFQAAIAERGLPALRLEVTSVLRTADDQARLRRVNPNAARGESTHQFGTTFDVAYTSFVAPAEPVLELELDGAPWMERHLRRMEAMAAETGAARMSRELQAILGRVLREMQDEGKVMVTMEILQPVYHLTVARRMAADG